MTTTFDLPLPGDRIDGRTVIASCYGRDEGDDADFNVLLLLNDTPGSYYSVVEATPTGSITDELSYPNIVPAAEAYQELSGAWDGDLITHDATGAWRYTFAPEASTGMTTIRARHLRAGHRMEIDGRRWTVLEAIQHPELGYWHVSCEPVPGYASFFTFADDDEVDIESPAVGADDSYDPEREDFTDPTDTPDDYEGDRGHGAA